MCPLKFEKLCPIVHQHLPFPSTLSSPYLERDLGERRLRDFMAYSILVSRSVLDLERKKKQLITVGWESSLSLYLT